MGRVRRYKKYKSVDPFAKGQRSETDLVHDEPPDLHEDRGDTVIFHLLWASYLHISLPNLHRRALFLLFRKETPT